MPLELPKKAKGERPTYLGDPAVDNVLSIALALAGEVVVLRERLDTVERLLEGAGGLSRAQVDDYRPSPQVIEEREAARARFLDVVLRSVQQEREGLQEAAAKGSYARHMDFVSNP